jgi:hypothetical protein
MSKSTDKRFEEINKLFDDLLGAVEDWQSQDIDQFLADAGVDIAAANQKLYERVSEIAGTYRARNENVPEPIVEFLGQMRPIDRLPQDSQAAKSAARKWIATRLRPKPQLNVPQVVYSFRNKKDHLSIKDQAFLEVLEARLKNRRQGDT